MLIFQDRLSFMHVVGDNETHAQTCTSLLIKLMQITIYLVSLLTFAVAGPCLTHRSHFFSQLLQILYLTTLVCQHYYLQLCFFIIY